MARKGEFPVLQEQPGQVRPQPSSVSQIPTLSTSFIFICVLQGGRGRGVLYAVSETERLGLYFFFVLFAFYFINLSLDALLLSLYLRIEASQEASLPRKQILIKNKSVFHTHQKIS